MIDFEVCGRCRGPTRLMCRICGTKTEKKAHDFVCFKIDKSFQISVPTSILTGQA